MSSEFNHIDDLFRRKESEYIPDAGRTSAHWEKMQQMLNPAPLTPGKKYRISRTRRILRYIGGFTVVTIISVVLVTSPKTTKKNLTKVSEVKTVATTKKAITSVQPNRTPDIKPKSALAATVKPKNGSTANLSRPSQSASAKAKLVSRKTPQKIKRDFTLNNTTTSTTNIPVNAIRRSPESPEKLITIASVPKKDAREVLTEFYTQISKEEQVFTINASKDTALRCAEGTLVKIPAEVFSDKKGNSKNGKIQIIIREFYQYDDMVKERLSTISDGKQLVSGGMLHIRAEADGEEAVIKNGKSINVEMPTDNYDERMQLFIGENSPEKHPVRVVSDNITVSDSSSILTPVFASNSGLNWVAAGQQQTFLKQRRSFKVFDAAGNPYKTKYGKKITAYFLVGHDTRMPDKEIKEKLQQRYGLLYDKIKVRRLLSGNKSVNLFTREERPVVGDSVEMNFQSALKLKLVSAEDSATYMGLLRQDSIYNESQMKLRSSYKFTLTSMGWINCDRFLKEPGPKVDFTLNMGEGYEAGNFVSHLIFPRFKSLVTEGSYAGSRIRFDNIPENEKVKLISLGVKDGKVVSCIQQFEAGKNEQTGLLFEETTPEEFAKKLKQLRISTE